MLKSSISGRAVFAALVAVMACGGDPPTDPEPQPPIIARVIVTPAVDTFPIGRIRILQARAETADGLPVQGIPAYTSSDAAIASVTPTGTVTGLRMGSAMITATIGGVSGHATLRIGPTIALGPDLPSLFSGDTVHLRWEVREALGGAPGPTPALASRATGIATISPSGVVTGLQPGLATIVASYDVSAESLGVAVLARKTGVNREIAAACTFAGRVCVYGASADTVTPADQRAISYAWSPDGSRLAIVNWHEGTIPELWVMNADGTNASRRAQTAWGEWSPWSPNGQVLAFQNINNSISLLSLSSGSQGPLTSNPIGQDDSPQYAPDGRRVAFRRANALWWASTTVPGLERRVSVPGGVVWFRWSPDGRWIAVGSWEVSASGFEWIGVWLVRPDGSELRPLSPNCGPGPTCTRSGDYLEPSWSPDGSQIVMHWLGVGVSPPPTGYEVRSFASGTLVARHEAPGLSNPHWSPDGRRIAWVGYRPGTDATVVFTSRIDGTDVRQVGSDTVSGPPRWRPSP